MKIVKRNGQIEEFDENKIKNAVTSAYNSLGRTPSVEFIDSVISNVDIYDGITVEEIQDRVENALVKLGNFDVAKAYILYRAERALRREQKTKGIFRGIINVENNLVTRENANMNSDSPAGMMMKFASESTKPFVDSELLSDDVLEAIKKNYLHVHDKDYYPTRSLTCLQTPLDKILSHGFKAGHGESRGAKRIETAAVLAAISMETTQNEQHGGQAIPAFDFYMAPYVRLTYIEEVNKIKELITSTPNEEYWDAIKNTPIKDYLYKDLSEIHTDGERYVQHAINNTVKRVHQAMESFIHNMNSIHSRGGRLDCLPLQ